MDDPKNAAAGAVERIRDEILGLSRTIHQLSETGFEEHRSAAAVSTLLRDQGFALQKVNELPTAFIARKGTGTLHLGICAEYDALPGIGHACGHNIIAASAVGAAVALGEIADELDITVSVLGTPAEEGGGGKVLMLQNGSFDGLHAAMMVHAAPIERDEMATLAVAQLVVTFHGRAAHASASPHRGVSASAAMTLAQNGIALLREHLLASDRVHGVVVHGGDAPNIVPDRTVGRWYVRAQEADRLLQLNEQVVNIFKGAALMTGCSVEIVKEAPTYTEIRTHSGLAECWRTNAASLGRMSTPVQPTDGAASTDMGNVSYAMPTIHPMVAVESDGANIHEAAFAIAAAGPSGDDAVLFGARCLAWTAIDAATDTALRNELLQSAYRVADVPAGTRSYLDESYRETISFP